MQHASKEFELQSNLMKIDKEVGPEGRNENNVSFSSSNMLLEQPIKVGEDALNDESSIHFNYSRFSRQEVNPNLNKSVLNSPQFILNDTHFSLGSPRYPISSNRTGYSNGYFLNSSLPKCLLNTNKNNNMQAFLP